MASFENHDSDIDALVDEAAPGVAREVIDDGRGGALRHFNLRHSPFADSVNPDLFFKTKAHDFAYAEMRRCIEEHVSMGLCTAPSGTGKTLLTQILLGSLDSRKYRAVLTLVFPRMSPLGMLREIARELGVAPALAHKASTNDLVSIVQDEIIRLYQSGTKLVIILDEVHFISSDCLHLLRTLSNIEVPERKLITILLFGEESFLKKLENPAYNSVFSRMFVRTALRALDLSEIEQYVKYRLLMAGGRPSLFTTETYDTILQRSRGIPREINRLCDCALRNAARRQAATVEPADFPAS